MNHFISGIIKIIILEAHAGLVLFDAVLKDRFEKPKKVAFIALAALMVFAWCNYGTFNGNGLMLIHHHEQFHFYLGAKYQAEVGWFDLYRAAILADSETTRAIHIDQLRDNATFELEPVSKAFDERDRIVGRFTPQRWEDFKRDWVLFMTPPNQAELDACEATKCIDPNTLAACQAACEQQRQMVTAQWRGRFNAILQDHGNSNSPAWSVIAHPIAMLVPWTPGGQALLGWLDMVLMAVMWWFVFKTFGWKLTSIGVLVWAMPPFVFPYLAGSFLRWDWLFALGMTMCMMKREKWLYAGLFFGYAVASKLFPLWFGVALGIRALINIARDWNEPVKGKPSVLARVPQKYRQMLIGTVISGVTAVVLASLMFGGPWVWSEYKRRIDTGVREKFYSNQYSLRTVYLQIVESSLGELAEHWLFPAEMKQQRNDVAIEETVFPVSVTPDGALWIDVDIPAGTDVDLVAGPSRAGAGMAKVAESGRGRSRLMLSDLRESVPPELYVRAHNHSLGLKLIQLLFTLAVVVLLLRTDEIGAFALGPVLVFTWLVVNAYYWNMFGLMAIGLARREGQKPALGALMGLNVIFMGYYLFVHTNRGYAEGYMVALQLCLWLAAFAFAEYRVLKAELTDFVSMLYGRKRA